MKQKDQDTLIISAVLKRLNEFRLPRALSLKKKVDAGDALDDSDLKFLRRALDDTKELNPILERNPEYLELRDKALGLVEQILEKDAQNQKG